MGTNHERKVTEEEFFFVEEAFLEFKNHGFTQKKCPWCGENLAFEDKISAHTVFCTSCDLKVTARGI